MAEPFKLGDVRGEVQAISCLKSFKPDTNYAKNSLPVRPDMGYFGVSVKKEDEQSNHTKGRQHAFKKIWERNIDPRPRLVGMRSVGQGSYSINWKQWPPPIPEIVPGLKIPVEMVPQVNQRLSKTGIWREVKSGTEAKPLDPESGDFFNNMQGSLNTPMAQWFSIAPPSLLFLNSKIGEFYQVTLKLRNIGHIPRRIRVIPPYSKSFQVLWGADLNEKTLISPGLITRIVVQFKPADNNSINDILMVVIDNDGALIVPMMSAMSTPPLLETAEWNCGCSAVGSERTKCFDLKNVGGDARFWILTEEEFRKEYLAVYREFEKKRDKKRAESSRRRNVCKVKSKFKLDQVYTKSFRVFPSSFRLQRNQKIDIKIRYHPKEASFHYEKLALLCDNGEVRWIAMRGMGLDTKSPGILELKGDWSAPPCDLPSDTNAKFIIDCGDLTPGESTSPKFTVINKSCLPLYFFWCLRPITNYDGALTSSTTKNVLQHQIEGSLKVEWEDYAMKMDNSRPMTPSSQIGIFPAQGIIEGNQEIVCTVSVYCPQGSGYHSGILSLFVEQVNDAAMAIILPLIRELEEADENDIPMHYDDLIETMPENKTPDTLDQYKSINQRYEGKGRNRKSTEINMKDDDAPQMPIYLMKRKNTQTHDISFGLTQLQMQGEAAVAAVNDNKINTNVEVPEEEQESKPECEEVKVEKSNPLNMYQKLMERQNQLLAAQKTGNLENIEMIPSEKIEEKSANPESKLIITTGDKSRIESKSPINAEENVSTVNKSLINTDEKARTENRSPKTEDKYKGEEEGEDDEGAPVNTALSNEKKNELSDGEVSLVVTPSRREGGSFGGITEEMSAYIRRSIVTGPKMWLKDTSALMPVKEVEIWMRSIPLQCWFYPPFVIATGTSGWVIERHVMKLVPEYASYIALVKVGENFEEKFYNQSMHPIEVEWEKLIDNVCCISCDPQVLLVKPSERSAFRVKIQFQKFGKMFGKLNGTMRLPFSKFPCNIALDITTTSPAVEIMTPLLSFGLLTFGTEKVKSLAIKNTGIKRAKWRAKLADEALENEESQIIAKHQTKIVSGQLLRVWPQWGVLDPGEVAGAQVYLSAEVQGRVATSIEIIIDENPNLTTYVTVCAEVQSPCLFFDNSFFSIPKNSFETETSYQANVKIINPTGFHLAYSWQCPIGRQSKSCKIEIDSQVGLVGPKASTECQVTVTNPDNLSIYNLFVPCCVEGMKEPMILKIFNANS